jgi:hypothetical protein
MSVSQTGKLVCRFGGANEGLRIHFRDDIWQLKQHSGPALTVGGVPAEGMDGAKAVQEMWENPRSCSSHEGRRAVRSQLPGN